MSKSKIPTPINTNAVLQRAKRKLGEVRQADGTITARRAKGSIVKPVHLSKTDPTVKKILELIE